MPEKSPIVFFDGVCGLCNQTVDYLLRRDRLAVLRFSPLQGKAAKELLKLKGDNFDSIIYLDETGEHTESGAIARMLWRIGGFSRVIGALLFIIPPILRNACYRVIARNRYNWFGKKETCRIPTAEERSRFLD